MVNRDRIHAMAIKRRAEPRRGLQVNDMVAAVSNPNLFTQQAQGANNVNRRPGTSHSSINHMNNHANMGHTLRDSGYQSSTGNISGHNIFGGNITIQPGTNPKDAQYVIEFPC